MLIREAIEAARELRDTEIGDKQLLEWLSAHDQNVFDRALVKYGANAEEEPYSNLPYTQYWVDDPDDRDLDFDLILPDKYAFSLYPIYLVMMIDLQHGDYERYNNDAMLYGDTYQRMMNDITRENKWRPPKPDYVPEDKPWHPVGAIRF